MKKLLLFGLGILLLMLFFSFKLDKVPDGMTVDEEAFAYNGVLLSRTLRDQNNRFLPVFVLSTKGTDWRQPFTQYPIAAIFKFFEPSVWAMRFTSVLYAVFSVILLFVLVKQLLVTNQAAIIAVIIFATTPLVLIQAHLALDPMALVPFVLLWILGMRNKNPVLSALALGFSFYAYRGMRAVIPVWSLLSLGYFFLQNKKKSLIFFACLTPFFLMAPILEWKYAGAVMTNQKFNEDSIYDFLQYYLGSFDPSFVFITGDQNPMYSVGKYGMFLISVLPVFVWGLWKGLNDKNPLWRFLVFCLALGPLLYGYVGSTHHAHRLMFMVPFIVLFVTLGFVNLNKIFKGAFLLIMFLNFTDFINFFWYKFPEQSKHLYISTQTELAYKKLSEVTDDKTLIYVSHEIADRGENDSFFRAKYFKNKFPEWTEPDLNLPSNSVILTTVQQPNSKLEEISTGVSDYYIYRPTDQKNK